MIFHGWIFRKPQDPVARCGGPGFCPDCCHEAAHIENFERAGHADPRALALAYMQSQALAGQFRNPIRVTGWRPGEAAAGTAAHAPQPRPNLENQPSREKTAK